jgi:hypothetical protein
MCYATPFPSPEGLQAHAGCTLTEPRLIRRYLALFLMAPGEDGAKIVSLARFGSYEVRLIEFEEHACLDSPSLWMELYAHDAASSLDSCGCSTLDDAAAAAAVLIAHAKALYRRSALSGDKAIRQRRSHLT